MKVEISAIEVIPTARKNKNKILIITISIQYESVTIIPTPDFDCKMCWKRIFNFLFVSFICVIRRKFN